MALAQPLFRMVIFFFYFGYPDLSLTTQTRFSNLTILNTHKQRTDKLCLVAGANEFVALKDNQKGTLAPSDNLTNVRVTLDHCVAISEDLNLNFSWGSMPPDPPHLLTLTRSH